ncbi:MAG: emopamil-binding family protein [Myxococcota bacterium]
MSRRDDTALPPADWVDRALVATFVSFAATSLLFDRAAALDWVGPDVADPFGRALWWYGTHFDPLVAENPLFLRVMSALSAFVFGPFYFVLAWGLAKRRAWIRLPAVAYASVMLYSMGVHVVVELWCDTPPPNLWVFFGTYLAYIAAPLVLLRRMTVGGPR